MPNLFRNNAATTLASPVLTSDTTLVLATNTGARFPTPVIGEWFFVTVQSGVNFEIMKCTARAGDILTVERAQDGSSLQNWLAGNSVDMRIPRITLENFVQKNEVAPLAAGSAASPSVTFGDTDTGIYGPAAGEIALAINGSDAYRIRATGIKHQIYGSDASTIYLVSGTTRAFRVTTDVSSVNLEGVDQTGAASYQPLALKASEIVFATGSSPVERLRLSATGQLQSGSGTAAAPAYSFSGDTDTGIYGNGANELSFAVAGYRAAYVSPGAFVIDNLAGASGVSYFARCSDASASNFRETSFLSLNESSVPLTGFRSLINTDGSGNIELYATPAGSRASDRRVLRATIPGSGPIALLGPVNVSSGDLDVAGNLRFNSGYGSAALAYGVRAWVNFNGTGTVAIRASGGVTSITDNATGDYTVNLNFTMPDTNYSVVGNAGPDIATIAAGVFYAPVRTTTSVRVITSDNNTDQLFDYARVDLHIVR